MTSAATPKRLVVLISGSGTNLQAIIDAIESGQLPNTTIAAVISNRPAAGGLERAKRHGIQALTLDHTTASSREAYDQALAAQVTALEPDYIILAGFMRILTEQFITPFVGKIINIHPSLLPKHKGLNTHRAVLEQGDTKHGCSVHYVTLDLDSGPIIGQACIEVQADSLKRIHSDRQLKEDELNKEAAQLQTSVQKLEHKLYPACLQWLVQERLSWDQDNGNLYLDGSLLPKTGYLFAGFAE